MTSRGCVLQTSLNPPGSPFFVRRSGSKASRQSQLSWRSRRGGDKKPLKSSFSDEIDFPYADASTDATPTSEICIDPSQLSAHQALCHTGSLTVPSRTLSPPPSGHFQSVINGRLVYYSDEADTSTYSRSVGTHPLLADVSFNEKKNNVRYTDAHENELIELSYLFPTEVSKLQKIGRITV